MPLIKSASKKAFQHNLEAEMAAGKPQNQSLAIAYDMKRRSPKKKMASGGMINESAKTEQRPMPSERDQDSASVARNSSIKAPSNDSWSSNVTVSQAQRPSITKLSRPSMVPSSVINARLRDQEEDLINSMPPKMMAKGGSVEEGPSEKENQAGVNRIAPNYDRAHSEVKHGQSEMRYGDKKAEAKRVLNELRSMPKPKLAQGGMINEAVSMKQAEEDRVDHPAGLEEDDDQMSPAQDEYMSKNRMAPMLAHGGEIDEDEGMDSRPDKGWGAIIVKPGKAQGGMIDSEEEMDHQDSIAAAIMAKEERQKRLMSDSDEDQMVMMADGGILSRDSIYSDDSDQADVARNAQEDANEEDQLSFNALRKENYSESHGLDQLDSPMDSNEHGHDLSDEDSHDMVGKIMAKAKRARQFKAR